ncbi:MAG TPA: class I SAM-dependent methyltransferase [Solirubrobacteraceae bacterium]|jgi:ubiquinone/menaquinone biosynthesis C-methylase UbiE|nr:class I SAM-dependent methyltransferase [Solirubrobacteraceae bacterium]
MTSHPATPVTPALDRYRAFPNAARRNAMQEILEVPALVRLLDIPRRARILEVGCGRGIALAPLARLCQPTRLTGLEIDPQLLSEARDRLTARGVQAELVCGDVREMPFLDQSFDVIVDFGTCYHIGGPELALREITRVLADGGVFVHETPLSQLLAHPHRATGRKLPWSTAPGLTPNRTAALWSARLRVAPA